MASNPPPIRLPSRRVLAGALLAIGGLCSACETILGYGDEPKLRAPADAATDVTLETDASDGSDDQSVQGPDADVFGEADQGSPDAEEDADAAEEPDDGEAPVDADASDSEAGAEAEAGAAGPGHILVAVGIDDQRIRRIAAEQGAPFEDLMPLILAANPILVPDAAFVHKARRATQSRDGKFLALVSEYWSSQDEFVYVFKTGTWERQPLSVQDLDGPSTFGTPSLPALVVAGGLSAIYEKNVASDWEVGGYPVALFLTTRGDVATQSWSVPKRLFPDPFEMMSHAIGDINRAGTRVASACGNEQGLTDSREAICESDWSQASPEYRVLARASDGATSHTAQLSHPVYDAQDNILFSANWIDGSPNLKQLWRIRRSDGKVEQVSASWQYNSEPCVLPNGDIAAVTKDGDYMKIRVMDADGKDLFLLDVGAAIYEAIGVELGLTCSE